MGCLPKHLCRNGMEARRPDLVLYDNELNRIVIFEMSCPGDSRIGDAFAEKLAKYQMLRLDLLRLYPKWSVYVCPVIIGSLGTYDEEKMRTVLEKAHPVFKGATRLLMGNMQRSVLYGSSRIVKNHLAKRN